VGSYLSGDYDIRDKKPTFSVIEEGRVYAWSGLINTEI